MPLNPRQRNLRGSGSSGPGGGGPGTIAGLQLWLAADASPMWTNDARSTPATVDGAALAAWDDLSGQGNHVLQTTSGRRPLLKLAILNGRSVVRFDGADDRMAVASAAVLDAPAAFSVFVVALGPAPNAAGQMLIAKSGNIVSADGWRMYQDPTTDGRVVWRSNAYSLGVTGALNATWRVLSGTHVSGAQAVRINGGTPTTGTSVTAVATNAAFVQLGCGGSGSELFAGDIAEVLIFDTALAAADRQYVERWLGAKYAIAVA